MRTPLPLLGAIVALTLLTACGPVTARGDAAAAATPSPTPTRTVAPASAAGGACYLLDFADIAAALDVQFEVAAASKQQKTSACVAQRTGASRPDLVVTATPTSADGTVFAAQVKPKGAATVKGLGAAAYQRTLPPKGGAGPAAEVGWLTGDGRLLTLCFTYPPDAEKDAAATILPGLVALAKRIDRTSI
ncbi:hypothetical protein [Rhizomonospora bruguierae]|uniref:hypothetical protein n=1 Tax=Rhizomonospora bruguierae TaxID=1581705 RepID=UPI001BD14B4B|nr:hypothetical protein [Micromonospora sp. NBRC 107566]